jgi:hypothetical protein
MLERVDNDRIIYELACATEVARSCAVEETRQYGQSVGDILMSAA